MSYYLELLPVDNMAFDNLCDISVTVLNVPNMIDLESATTAGALERIVRLFQTGDLSLSAAPDIGSDGRTEQRHHKCGTRGDGQDVFRFTTSRYIFSTRIRRPEGGDGRL